MKVKFEKKFLKDLENLDKISSYRLKEIIFEVKSLKHFNELKNIKKLTWYTNYYRIRLWDYRIWIKYYQDEIIFIRVKHRKDIYKLFP